MLKNTVIVLSVIIALFAVSYAQSIVDINNTPISQDYFTALFNYFITEADVQTRAEIGLDNGERHFARRMLLDIIINTFLIADQRQETGYNDDAQWTPIFKMVKKDTISRFYILHHFNGIVNVTTNEIEVYYSNNREAFTSVYNPSELWKSVSNMVFLEKVQAETSNWVAHLKSTYDVEVHDVSTSGIINNKTVIRVGDKTITYKEFERLLKYYDENKMFSILGESDIRFKGFNSSDPSSRILFRDELLKTLVLYHAALESGYTDDSDTMTVINFFISNECNQIYLNHMFKQDLNITADDYANFVHTYEKYSTDLQTMMRDGLDDEEKAQLSPYVAEEKYKLLLNNHIADLRLRNCIIIHNDVIESLSDNADAKDM